MTLQINQLKRISIILLTLCLVACVHGQSLGTTPMPEAFDQNSQKHLQAVDHWRIIAQDTATQIVASIDSKKMKNATFYINPQSEITPFNRAFYDFLMESLIKNEIKITPDKYRGIPINYKIQAVEFQADRNPYFDNKMPWSTLTAGVLVARGISHVLDSSVPTTMAIAGAADLWQINKGYQLDLIVTTSIINNNLYIFRNSDVYYANAIDLDLYRRYNRTPNAKVFKDPFYQY